MPLSCTSFRRSVRVVLVSLLLLLSSSMSVSALVVCDVRGGTAAFTEGLRTSNRERVVNDLLTGGAFHSCTRSLLLYSSSSSPNHDDDCDASSSSSLDLSNFNPFQYQTETTRSSSTTDTNKISLRRMRMQQLVERLLNAHGDNEGTTMQSILQDHKDFLLDPMVNVETAVVDDPDSIYNNCRTTQARIQAYQTNMQRRIASAKNQQTRDVLTIMMDYVCMEFEKEQQKQEQERT